jgi:hypothetical protein
MGWVNPRVGFGPNFLVLSGLGLAISVDGEQNLLFCHSIALNYKSFALLWRQMAAIGAGLLVKKITYLLNPIHFVWF